MAEQKTYEIEEFIIAQNGEIDLISNTNVVLKHAKDSITLKNHLDVNVYFKIKKHRRMYQLERNWYGLGFTTHWRQKSDESTEEDFTLKPDDVKEITNGEVKKPKNADIDAKYTDIDLDISLLGIEKKGKGTDLELRTDQDISDFNWDEFWQDWGIIIMAIILLVGVTAFIFISIKKGWI